MILQRLAALIGSTASEDGGSQSIWQAMTQKKADVRPLSLSAA
jgi:hypothetical protein